MIKKTAITLIVLSAMLLSGCTMFKSASGRTAEQPAPAAATKPGAPERAVSAGEYATKDMSNLPKPTDRIVIKNANLSIAVLDPVTALQSITSMAEGMGGFVVSSNVYKTTTSKKVEVPVADITIRVPSEQLDSAMLQIKALVPDAKTDVLSENISGQDVTSEYTDTESRLNNLKAAEQQLVKIMEKAEKTEDVMSVFRELTNVREQIEVLQGQLNYYKESARLSAISIHIQAKEALKPITIGGWQPGLELQKAFQALINGLKFLVNLFIWLIIYLLPILVVIALPIYLIVRALRKHRPSTKPVEVKKPEIKK